MEATAEQPTQVTDAENAEQVTMSKAEYEKAIQSAEDKLRTKYSLQIKDLEAKIPKEKSNDEKDFESRLAALEAKEKHINMIDSLTAKNLDKSFAEYLKDDADVDKFAEFFAGLKNKTAQDSGFKPTAHSTGTKITQEEFNKLDYAQKAKLYEQYPDVVKNFL